MLNFISNLFSVRSGKWNSLRKNYLEKNSSCIACGTEKKLRVHHIEPVHINPARELEEDNLCTLCDTCHLVFGHLHNWTKFNPSVLKDSREHYKRVQENTIIKDEKKTLWKKFFE